MRWKGRGKMCLAVPGEIIVVSHTQAKVDIIGVEMTINIQLIDKPKIGDYVLIHAGCAIEKVDKCYFNDLSTMFKSIIDKDEKTDG